MVYITSLEDMYSKLLIKMDLASMLLRLLGLLGGIKDVGG